MKKVLILTNLFSLFTELNANINLNGVYFPFLFFTKKEIIDQTIMELLSIEESIKKEI